MIMKCELSELRKKAQARLRVQREAVRNQLPDVENDVEDGAETGNNIIGRFIEIKINLRKIDSTKSDHNRIT